MILLMLGGHGIAVQNRLELGPTNIVRAAILADLSEIDVEQDGRRARLRTAPGPTIDPICRAIGIALPPVFQEMPPVP